MSQASKTLLTLGALLLLAGGVGLYAWFGVYQKDEATSTQRQRETRVYAGEGDADDAGAGPDFVKLVITFQGASTTLERDAAGAWRITAPVQAAADKLVVDSAISQLHTARFTHTIDEAPDAAALETFGLTHPTFTVEAFTRGEDGAPRRALRLEGGIENTFDGSVFVRRDGAPTVYAAPGNLRFSLARGTYELRDKQVLAVDEAKLTKVTVKARANAYTLERRADKRWAFTAPVAALADGVQVTGMLSSLSGLKAQAFVDDTPQQRTAKGLDNAPVDVTFTDDTGRTVRLRLSKSGSPEAVYALREDASGATLAQVPEAALGALDRNPADLKDRTLLHFDAKQVTRLVFHNADGSEVVLAKASAEAPADAWRVVTPREGKAQVFKVTSALWTLGAYRSLAIIDARPRDLGRYGLGAGARYVSVQGPDGELARLTIGAPVPDKADTFYVLGSDAVVAEVDGSRFSEFPTIIGDVLQLEADAGAP